MQLERLQDNKVLNLFECFASTDFNVKIPKSASQSLDLVKSSLLPPKIPRTSDNTKNAPFFLDSSVHWSPWDYRRFEEVDSTAWWEYFNIWLALKVEYREFLAGYEYSKVPEIPGSAVI